MGIYITIGFVFCFNILSHLDAKDPYRHPIGVMYWLVSKLFKKKMNYVVAAVLTFPLFLLMGALWPITGIVELVVRNKQIKKSKEQVTQEYLLSKGFVKIPKEDKIVYLLNIEDCAKILISHDLNKYKWSLQVEKISNKMKVNEINYSTIKLTRNSLSRICSECGVTIEEIDFWDC